jgi:hypothetical protein
MMEKNPRADVFEGVWFELGTPLQFVHGGDRKDRR